MVDHKRGNTLASTTFGLLKAVVGLFMIWGQFVFAERGTFYGFSWPNSLHDLLADWRTIVLFVVAGWLLYTGISGIKPKQHANTPPA